MGKMGTEENGGTAGGDPAQGTESGTRWDGDTEKMEVDGRRMEWKPWDIGRV